MSTKKYSDEFKIYAIKMVLDGKSSQNPVAEELVIAGTIVKFQYPAITREAVETALALYSSGGSNSRAIVDTYDTAVAKLCLVMESLRGTLPDPTRWAELQGHEVAEEQFNSAFKAALKQLNSVKQYYEFAWDDERFGIDEHSWLQYIGAYKNLNDKDPKDEIEIRELISQTMLIDTHLVDLPFILKLIKDKINTQTETQQVDEESLRIIYEQIEELSNMGDHRQASLLKDFVDQELITGKIPSSIHFDDAFAN